MTFLTTLAFIFLLRRDSFKRKISRYLSSLPLSILTSFIFISLMFDLPTPIIGSPASLGGWFGNKSSSDLKIKPAGKREVLSPAAQAKVSKSSPVGRISDYLINAFEISPPPLGIAEGIKRSRQSVVTMVGNLRRRILCETALDPTESNPLYRAPLGPFTTSSLTIPPLSPERTEDHPLLKMIKTDVEQLEARQSEVLQKVEVLQKEMGDPDHLRAQDPRFPYSTGEGSGGLSKLLAWCTRNAPFILRTIEIFRGPEKNPYLLKLKEQLNESVLTVHILKQKRQLLMQLESLFLRAQGLIETIRHGNTANVRAFYEPLVSLYILPRFEQAMSSWNASGHKVETLQELDAIRDQLNSTLNPVLDLVIQLEKKTVLYTSSHDEPLRYLREMELQESLKNILALTREISGGEILFTPDSSPTDSSPPEPDLSLEALGLASLASETPGIEEGRGEETLRIFQSIEELTKKSNLNPIPTLKVLLKTILTRIAIRSPLSGSSAKTVVDRLEELFSPLTAGNHPQLMKGFTELEAILLLGLTFEAAGGEGVSLREFLARLQELLEAGQSWGGGLSSPSLLVLAQLSFSDSNPEETPFKAQKLVNEVRQYQIKTGMNDLAGSILADLAYTRGLRGEANTDLLCNTYLRIKHLASAAIPGISDENVARLVRVALSFDLDPERVRSNITTIRHIVNDPYLPLPALITILEAAGNLETKESKGIPTRPSRDSLRDVALNPLGLHPRLMDLLVHPSSSLGERSSAPEAPPLPKNRLWQKKWPWMKWRSKPSEPQENSGGRKSTSPIPLLYQLYDPEVLMRSN